LFIVVSIFSINFKFLNRNFLLSSAIVTYLITEVYTYTSQSIGMAKWLNSGSGSRIGLGYNPTISPNQGNTVSIHLINEDSDTHSKHNINIDDFDALTNELGYSKPNNYIQQINQEILLLL